MQANENKHLICPITQDLFEDPISVPCCGQTYSRNALVECLRFKPECPMCRGDLSRFNAAQTARNVVIAGLVEEFASGVRLVDTNADQKLDWSVTCQEIVDRTGKSTGEYQQVVQLNDANLSVKPTLFIAVCDRSGSMGGQPWSQVENALLHMIGLSRGSRVVQLGCVMYESTAEIIDISQVTRDNIRSYFTGGGTVFPDAFNKIGALLRANRNGIYDRAIVAFMTDGQSGQNRDMLATQLREVIRESWTKPCIVHSIGFGACDKDLLELLRNCGYQEGVFRFSDLNDDPDMLTTKITDLFDEVQRAASVELMINGELLRMPIEGKTGRIVRFVRENVNNVQLNLAGLPFDVPVEQLDVEYNTELFTGWARKHIDKLANNALELIECKDPAEQQVHVSVLRQQISRMETMITDENILGSLELIKEQLTALQDRRVVDIGRLRDLRFASRFAVRKANGGVKGRDLEIRKAILPATVPALAAIAYNEPRLINYKYCSDEKNRNELQKLIMSGIKPCKLFELVSRLAESAGLTKETILHEDLDGNNALHLAAFDGQYSALEILLKYVTLEEASRANPNTDTAFTLAIKKQGWDKTLSVLVNFGMSCPVERMKALQRFCVDNNYLRTSAILTDLISAGGNVSDDMSVEIAKELSVAYVKFVYNSWKLKGKDTSAFWKVALSKGYELFDMAKEVYHECKIAIELEDLLNWCYPKKPDAEDTENYIQMATFVLDAKPELVTMSNAAGETPLYKAVEKGSLPHVKLMLARGANLEARNELGNTALWLACAKKYPCIIEELLDNGADVNAVNLKGNPPIYATCQVGPLKIAEMLMIRGADAEIVNQNGDTLVLIATRNGQAEILELLLRYVRKDFANHVAHIDGFNAVFASVEANRVNCIDVLYRYGMDYNQRTAKDNAILADATPLHLAAYYNRVEAVQKLLEIGVTVDAVSGSDIQGMTPLQIATIQGNLEIVKLLVGAGADKAKALMFASGEIAKVLVDCLDLSNVPMLKKYWHQYWNIIDIVDADGYTPLSWAVLEGDLKMTEALLAYNADPSKKNRYGLSARDYAKISRQVRLIELVGESGLEVPQEVRQMLFVTGISRQRMPVEIIWQEKMLIVEDVASPLLDEQKENGSLVRYINRSEQLKEYLPMARLRALNMIMSKSYPVEVKAVDALAIELYKMLGNRLDDVGRMYAMQSIALLPTYKGEVFVNLDRRFAVGSNVTVGLPFCGSSLWRIATREFDPKRGTVGIFKGVAKYLGGSNCEVLVMPKEFTVKAVYHYDPICLGQANIREHTFRIKDNDLIQAVVLLFE